MTSSKNQIIKNIYSANELSESRKTETVRNTESK